MKSLIKFNFSQIFTLFTLINVALVSSISIVAAGAVTDVINVCSRWADAPLTRSEEFIDLGWALVADRDEAALPIAHANVLSSPPQKNTKKDWSDRIDYEESLQGHLDWPYVFEKGNAFVFLGRLSPTNPGNYATCVLAGAIGKDLVDVFSEAEALGTPQINQGIIRARISRSVLEEDQSGWISIISGFGLTEELNLPGQLASSMKLTVVNGPLRGTSDLEVE